MKVLRRLNSVDGPLHSDGSDRVQHGVWRLSGHRLLPVTTF